MTKPTRTQDWFGTVNNVGPSRRHLDGIYACIVSSLCKNHDNVNYDGTRIIQDSIAAALSSKR